ncbi:hypothetical protein Ciccas_002119 [Cichlidogyrus casuarinus]|uniref:Cilia- and flagella-associated protein 69 ARM repeats domain-containing protein n=1 Tax=Cichlidogyrus casuarinus TaxID=1844966 RepID=A0ABD2QI80_9PLAT
MTSRENVGRESLPLKKCVISTIEAIWCCIIGSPMSEERFLASGGLYLLMDLIKLYSDAIVCQILGCIADLLENPKAVKHLKIWRSGMPSKNEACGKKSFAKVLCELWECSKASFARESEEEALPTNSRSEMPLSEAIVNVCEDFRANIYGIFLRFDFEDFAQDLTTEDLLSLAEIKVYMDLKTFEVWQEIYKELDAENNEPVEADAQMLREMMMANEKAFYLLNLDKQFLEEEQIKKDLVQENYDFAKVRLSQKQKEKTIEKFSQYLSRTSKYKTLLAMRKEQKSAIISSKLQTIVKEEEACIHHETGIKHSNNTLLIGGSVKVESTEPSLFHIFDANEALIKNLFYNKD